MSVLQCSSMLGDCVMCGKIQARCHILFCNCGYVDVTFKVQIPGSCVLNTADLKTDLGEEVVFILVVILLFCIIPPIR